MLPPKASSEELGERLDSWKQIAAYLNRDARTVQRWEKSEGLPIHRHPHEAQASVYAYTVELDAWRTDRSRTALPRADDPPGPGAGRTRLLWGAGLALALVLVTSGSHGFHRSRPFQERDWVLLEGFENHTGEALFDGTLQAALERELSVSEFVNVAPRERVEDALRLMKAPTDAVLNADQAREVCLRDGGIRALVTGRTEKLGSTYLISAEVIDPVQNRTLASNTETASGQDQIWPAVRRLSNWVRETLGETMERIDRSNRQLEKVTTPSLRALQLFTEADSASRRSQWAISAQLTRQAIIEDPGFASAHIWLAFALHNLNDPEWNTEAQRAFDLSGNVSERERYFILGSYELLMDHPDRALPAFEALVSRYPDHYFAYLNLENIYVRLGRVAESAEIYARLADQRPNDSNANARAAYAVEVIDLMRARPYAQRAVELGSLIRPSNATLNVTFFHAHDLWMHDDVQGSFAELERILARNKESPNPINSKQIAFTIAWFHLTLGKFQSARQIFASIDHPLAMWDPAVSFFKGDEDHARQGAAQIPPNPDGSYQGLGGFLVARLWPPGAEKKLLGEKDPWIRGEVALTQGRFQDAAALLQQAFDTAYGKHQPTARIADGLVTALEHSGHSQKALEVLEATSATRIWATPLELTYQAFWLRNQGRLSDYYHRLGREKDARQLDQQLRKLLAIADPDHPILLQLNSHETQHYTAR
jgi:tetratricopeptide (TPR) repeat protein